jgi:hypothetical protein
MKHSLGLLKRRKSALKKDVLVVVSVHMPLRRQYAADDLRGIFGIQQFAKPVPYLSRRSFFRKRTRG